MLCTERLDILLRQSFEGFTPLLRIRRQGLRELVDGLKEEGLHGRNRGKRRTLYSKAHTILGQHWQYRFLHHLHATGPLIVGVV